MEEIPCKKLQKYADFGIKLFCGNDANIQDFEQFGYLSAICGNFRKYFVFSIDRTELQGYNLNMG